MERDLARWAAGRAPGLLARAEEEALAELKRALLAAALEQREAAAPRSTSLPASTSRERAEPATSRSGDGIWAYCVTTGDRDLPTGQSGVHPNTVLQRVEHGGLAALVSRVPLAEFGEEALRDNLNDLEWLERVARAHEAVLEHALALTTIVPLRLCTIYEDESRVMRMLDQERDSLRAALDLLESRQEWGVKVLVDRTSIEVAARSRSPEAAALEKDLEATSGGGAYIVQRRLERAVRDVADRLIEALAEDVHARLQDWADDAVLNAPQNRDLSRHEGEMVLNAAYLVETEKVPGLRKLVDELRERHSDVGARLELTGPWPPYNFVPGTATQGAALT